MQLAIHLDLQSAHLQFSSLCQYTSTSKHILVDGALKILGSKMFIQYISIYIYIYIYAVTKFVQ